MLSPLAKSYFIITCHGWSGSHWLASALNTHPQVLCCHSALNIPATKVTWEDGKLKTTITERENARKRRGKASIDTLLDEVQSYGDAEIYGNIHAIRVRDLVELNTLPPTKKNCIIANLVRHPVSVVNSGAGQFEDMISWDIYALIESSDAVREVMDVAQHAAKKHNINLCDSRVRSFIAAAQHLSHLARDRKIAPEIKTILMEKVTSDRGYFFDAFNYLTQSRVVINEKYLDEVFSLGVLNSHKASKHMSPRLQYENWEPWQKLVFKETAKMFELTKLYSPLGYDFSFLE